MTKIYLNELVDEISHDIYYITDISLKTEMLNNEVFVTATWPNNYSEAIYKSKLKDYSPIKVVAHLKLAVSDYNRELHNEKLVSIMTRSDLQLDPEKGFWFEERDNLTQLQLPLEGL